MGCGAGAGPRGGRCSGEAHGDGGTSWASAERYSPTGTGQPPPSLCRGSVGNTLSPGAGHRKDNGVPVGAALCRQPSDAAGSAPAS